MARLRIAAGLGLLYVLWGSTFLGIHLAVASVPPLLVAGIRWTVAGGLLYAAVRPAGGLPWRAWARAALIATLAVVASNGGVTWAETRIDSGVAALVITSVSPWLVLIEAVRPGGRRPSRITSLGVLLGIAGVGLLVDPRGAVDPLALGVLAGSALAFAIGSTLARLWTAGVAPIVETAIQMIAGGLLLLVASAAAGEWSSWSPSSVTGASVAAIAYLTLFGSLAGYTVYGWLGRVASPALVGTYACANPVIALALGAWFADEHPSGRAIVAAVVVVAGVALVVAGQSTGRVDSRGGPAYDALGVVWRVLGWSRPSETGLPVTGRSNASSPTR